MLDIDAQDIRDQSADEREFLLALPQDAFYAFADAFALCFQIGEDALAGQETRAMFFGAAKLFVDLRDLPAKLGGFFATAIERSLLLANVLKRLIELRLSFLPLGVERFKFCQNDSTALGQSALMSDDIFSLDLNRAQPAVHLRQLSHQIENGGLVLLDLLIGLVELKLAIPERLLALLDQSAAFIQLCRQTGERFAFGFQRRRNLSQSFLCRLTIGIERLDLLGHLLELLAGVLLPLLR